MDEFIPEEQKIMLGVDDDDIVSNLVFTDDKLTPVAYLVDGEYLAPDLVEDSDLAWLDVSRFSTESKIELIDRFGDGFAQPTSSELIEGLS